MIYTIENFNQIIKLNNHRIKWTFLEFIDM